MVYKSNNFDVDDKWSNVIVTDDDDNEKDVDTKNGKDEKMEEDSGPKPRCLHKTCSIFLRNLAPTITKQEVEAVRQRSKTSMST